MNDSQQAEAEGQEEEVRDQHLQDSSGGTVQSNRAVDGHANRVNNEQVTTLKSFFF